MGVACPNTRGCGCRYNKNMDYLLLIIAALIPAIGALLGAALAYRKPVFELEGLRRFTARGATLATVLEGLVPVVYAAYLIYNRPPGPPERDANPIGFAVVVMALAFLGLLIVALAPLVGKITAWVACALHTRWGPVAAMVGAFLTAPAALFLGVLLFILMKNRSRTLPSYSSR